MPLPSYRRLSAIIGFVLLVLLLAALLYIFFFRPTPPAVTNAPPVGQPGGLPAIGPGGPSAQIPPPGGLPTVGGVPAGAVPSPHANGGLTQTTPLVETPTTEPALESDGRTLAYYQPNDGRFYRVTPDGQAERLSDTVFFNVERVTWSPHRDQAVLEYPDASKIVYDFRTKSQATLPKHWTEFSFSPDGGQLAFKSLGVDRDSRWLGVSATDGGSAEAIEPLGDNAKSVTIAWSPNRQIVAYQHEVTGADRQTIFFVGLHGENFQSMNALGLGLRAQWTPNGDRLFYSVSSGLSDYKPLLWVAGASGENIGADRHSLGLNTWADKCAFSGNDTAICAVPQSLPTGAGLAPGVADTIPDSLYEVNLSTSATRMLALPSTPITAERVIVTADRQWAILQDKASGRLYKIHL